MRNKVMSFIIKPERQQSKHTHTETDILKKARDRDIESPYVNK